MTHHYLDPAAAAERAVRRSQEYGEAEHLPYSEGVAHALEAVAVQICDADDHGVWYAGWDWKVVLDRH